MDLNAIINEMSLKSAQSAQDLKSKMSKADPNNPDEMLKAQLQYSNIRILWVMRVL